jgi:hypothetical protein
MNGNINNRVVVPYKMSFRIFQASAGDMAPFQKAILRFLSVKSSI